MFLHIMPMKVQRGDMKMSIFAFGILSIWNLIDFMCVTPYTLGVLYIWVSLIHAEEPLFITNIWIIIYSLEYTQCGYKASKLLL